MKFYLAIFTGAVLSFFATDFVAAEHGGHCGGCGHHSCGSISEGGGGGGSVAEIRWIPGGEVNDGRNDNRYMLRILIPQFLAPQLQNAAANIAQEIQNLLKVRMSYIKSGLFNDIKMIDGQLILRGYDVSKLLDPAIVKVANGNDQIAASEKVAPADQAEPNKQIQTVIARRLASLEKLGMQPNKAMFNQDYGPLSPFWNEKAAE